MSAHPSFVGSPQHVREPLLTQVQQHHQIEAAADKLVLRLGRERPARYLPRPWSAPLSRYILYIPALGGSPSSSPTLLEHNLWWETGLETRTARGAVTPFPVSPGSYSTEENSFVRVDVAIRRGF